MPIAAGSIGTTMAAGRPNRHQESCRVPRGNHSAAEKPNQIDYHRRILQWFGHYLKGDEAPAWITQGLTVIDAERATNTK